MRNDIFAQEGWICPKCGRVLAPSTMYCLWCCSDMKESITSTGTSIPKWDTTPIPVGSGRFDSSGKTAVSIAKDEPQTPLIAKSLEPVGYEVTAVVGTIKTEPQTERESE